MQISRAKKLTLLQEQPGGVPNAVEEQSGLRLDDELGMPGVGGGYEHVQNWTGNEQRERYGGPNLRKFEEKNALIAICE